jgi:tetratricopeptide (TPR) repeat protein
MPDENQFDFDVFISYSSRDKAWVRGELLARIEQAGLKAFIDFRDFTRGAPSIKEMERGVVKCRKTLAILTPDYIATGWGEFENIMVQTLDPANRELRLIPLLKAECKKPLRIGALTHIDFTDGADLDLAWRQLLTALGAPPPPEPPKEPRRDQWRLAHPYPMPPNFTGRVAERAMLDGWLGADGAHPLLSLRALGGFGKSALVWHWLTHDVDPAQWPRVVWWSFYEGDASFDHFLAETLHYLSGGKVDATKISAKDAVRTLLQMLQPPGTLLVLDGFERVLRAFGGLDAAYQGDEEKPEVGSGKSEGGERDCISPLAEAFLYHVALQPQLRSKVLLTTRLCPRVIEARGGGLLHGAREEQLRQMQPADAVEFFRAQGIRGTHTEIELACAPYGYHPLSLRLLAGLIVVDFQQPGDVAAAKALDVSGELVQRQHHVLERAYDSLTVVRRTVLGRIACFRIPMKYDALKALAGLAGTVINAKEQTYESTLDAGLRDLVRRGLLHHDAVVGRFDLHPIVRRYAYDRLATGDRTAAHARFRNYFAAVPPTEKIRRLEDLAPVIELYHHTVRAGMFNEAFTLYRDRLSKHLYYQLGASHLIIDLLRALFPDGEERPPHLKDESDQAWTLNTLANAYCVSGQPRQAVPLYQRKNAAREEQSDMSNLAIGLNAISEAALLPLGALRTAEASLHRSIALCREFREEHSEAVGHATLGRLLACRGAYTVSETETAKALKMFEAREDLRMQGVTWAHRVLCELLRLRCEIGARELIPGTSRPIFGVSAIHPAQCALESAEETAQKRHPYERDLVSAHWLLGAAYRNAGHTNDAERHLREALERCLCVSDVMDEADILIDLARLRAATGIPDEAQRLAGEALLIAERSGYVLQGADAHLELAKLALTRGDKAIARHHATEAHHLATCDGPPDYTYKAAYDEAAALLAQLAP